MKRKLSLKKDALSILARGGQGSLRDTPYFAWPSNNIFKNRVDSQSVVEMLGLINPEKMEAIFSMVLNHRDINDILKRARNLWNKSNNWWDDTVFKR